MSTTQHPLTDEQYERLMNRHIDPRCLADEAHSMGYEAGRTEKIMMSLPPQHLVFEKDTEWIEKDMGYRDRLLALVEFTANWEPVAAPAEPLARTLLAVPEGHGAPHHDAGKIKAEDYVLQVDKGGFIRAGIAHRQDQDGDWRTAGGRLITNAARRADRPDALTVWPAPTPPAVEVEMPSEHPAHLRDVEGWDGERFAYMALDGGGHWCGVDQDGVARVWPLRWIAAATLPDGTRARRAGERPDGGPRFVKTQEV